MPWNDGFKILFITYCLLIGRMALLPVTQRPQVTQYVSIQLWLPAWHSDATLHTPASLLVAWLQEVSSPASICSWWQIRQRNQRHFWRHKEGEEETVVMQLTRWVCSCAKNVPGQQAKFASGVHCVIGSVAILPVASQWTQKLIILRKFIILRLKSHTLLKGSLKDKQQRKLAAF